MYINGELTYKKPLNYQEEWSHLFKDDFKYKTVSLKTEKLTHVFVNHYGLVLKNGLLKHGCAPNIGWSKYDKGFYYSHWRKGIEQFLVCKYGKSLNYKELSPDSDYLLVHSPWFSYYFWITESLPRLLATKSDHNNLVLIYPESWKSIEFVNTTLKLFPTLKHEIIPQDVHLFVPKLTLPQVKPWTIMFIPDQVLEVNKLLSGLSKITNKNYPKRICITRQGTHRSFENFLEVKDLLNRYDFELIKMEEHSFIEQIQLMSNCSCAMGISGAGHTNIHFMRANSYFLDITAQQNLEKKKYKLHFWKLANIVGVNYLLQTSKIANNESNQHIPFYNRNIIVDLDILEQNIKLMIHE